MGNKAEYLWHDDVVSLGETQSVCAHKILVSLMCEIEYASDVFHW